MKFNLPKVGILAAVSVMAGGIGSANAADPYDKALEARVAALERELNVMQGDEKGKAIKPADVPTFLRAKGSGVKELTISGDLRLRYQYQTLEPQQPQVGNQEFPTFPTSRDRNQQSSRPTRFRLRVNFEYVMSDNMFLGFSFASGDAYGNDGTTATIANGFGKNQVFIDKAYLGWNVIPKTLTIIGGKQDLPLYVVDDFIYDKTDLRVTGLTEKFNFDITQSTKLELIAGQYIFADNVENNYSGTNTNSAANGNTGQAIGNRDVFWFVGQAIFTMNFGQSYAPAPAYDPKSTKPAPPPVASGYAWNFKIGPTFSIYATGLSNGAGTAAAPGNLNASGFPTGNTPGVAGNTAGFVSPAYNNANGVRQEVGQHSQDNLAIFSLPMEANFKIGNFAIKPYSEFGYNFMGDERAKDTLGVRATSFWDKSALVAGIRFGELKNKGSWSISADYRSIGVAAIDPNLNDPNWGLSQLNFRGMKLSAGYRFTNWLTGNINYYAGYNIRGNLRSSVVSFTTGAGAAAVIHDQNPGTGATIANGNAGSLGLNTPIYLPFASNNANQMIQVELNASF
jgi:Putative porin